MKQPKLIIAIFFLSISFLQAATPVEDYERTFFAWIKGNITGDRTIENLENLFLRIESDSEIQDPYYWQARIQLAIGQIHFFSGRKRQSIAALEESRELARDAVNSGSGADSWRIMSDAGSMIMIQKGVGYIIANSGEVQEQAEKALELDNSNIRAALIVAQGLINAPAIFGGNRKKGLADLEALTLRPRLSDEDLFFLYITLGDVYNDGRKKEKARSFYEKVADLFPRNPIVSEKLSSL